MPQSNNIAVWFEIPSADFKRAIAFYENVLATKLNVSQMGVHDMAMFPGEETAVSGCVIAGEGYAPSANGSVVYLNGGADLAVPLARVGKAGGKVLIDKTALPPGMGFFAQFSDSEGNRVGLYSMQ